MFCDLATVLHMRNVNFLVGQFAFWAQKSLCLQTHPARCWYCFIMSEYDWADCHPRVGNWSDLRTISRAKLQINVCALLWIQNHNTNIGKVTNLLQINKVWGFARVCVLLVVSSALAERSSFTTNKSPSSGWALRVNETEHSWLKSLCWKCYPSSTLGACISN